MTTITCHKGRHTIITYQLCIHTELLQSGTNVVVPSEVNIYRDTLSWNRLKPEMFCYSKRPNGIWSISLMIISCNSSSMKSLFGSDQISDTTIYAKVSKCHDNLAAVPCANFGNDLVKYVAIELQQNHFTSNFSCDWNVVIDMGPRTPSMERSCS